MVFRLTAVIPLIASITTLALAIVLLVSGSSTDVANSSFWLALNTSHIGGSIVEVSSADDDGSSSSDPLGGIIGSIPGLEPILDNITSSIGDGLDDTQGSLTGALIQGLGVKDTYIFYTTKMCEGTFQDDTNPQSGVNVDSCSSYRDQGSGLMRVVNSIPSEFTVGTAQVSVPLVRSLKSGLSSIVDTAVGVATAMTVFLSITCAAAGLTALSSGLGILRANSRLIVVVSLGFSSLGTTVMFPFAILVTSVLTAGKQLIEGIGENFNLGVKAGDVFLALTWVATIMILAANAYWFMVWFVEFRHSAFSRRSRTRDQIGNWRGIVAEVRQDFKTDGYLDGYLDAARTGAEPGTRVQTHQGIVKAEP